MIKWGHELVARAKARRNWKALPSDFELDAVRFTFRQIKPHFNRDAIRERIAASNATTFEELESVLVIENRDTD